MRIAAPDIRTCRLTPLPGADHLRGGTGGAWHNNTYSEMMWRMEPFAFGLAGGPPVAQGGARLPEPPGLCAALDREVIENTTLGVV